MPPTTFQVDHLQNYGNDSPLFDDLVEAYMLARERSTSSIPIGVWTHEKDGSGELLAIAYEGELFVK